MRRKIIVGLCVLALVMLGSLLYVFIPAMMPPWTNQAQIGTVSVEAQLKKMTLRDKVAKLFIFHKKSQNPKELRNFVQTIKPGGLILMGDNVPKPFETLRLKQLTSAISGGMIFPPFVAIDEEGGVVSRLKSDTFPGAEQFKSQPASAIRSAFEKRSALLRDNGITLNFGIVADVTDDANSFMYARVLGTDAGQASERVAAAVKASNLKTFSTLKHFPGHGEGSADSHYGIPGITISEREWAEGPSKPFLAGIDSGADFVMFGHLRYTFLDTAPASLSKRWHDLLEQKLRFSGISITDDMFMLANSGEKAYSNPYKNAVSALQAGNTMLLYVTENAPGASDIEPNSLVDYIVSQVQKGALSEELINQNVTKILTYSAKQKDFAAQ